MTDLMTDDTPYDQLLDQIEQSILLADKLQLPVVVEILTIAFREAIEKDAIPKRDVRSHPKFN